MGNLTIDDIRKLAELNLTPECYGTYLAIIEPNIRAIIPNYLKDWQNVEGYITMITMRRMGIFKTRTSFISIDDDAEEKYGDMLDITKFREVKKWNFKQKIEYLRNEDVLRGHSYKLLDMLRGKRNKIHEMGTVFSDKDLREFSMAYSIVFYIYATQESDNMSEEERIRIRNLAETWAEEALKFVRA